MGNVYRAGGYAKLIFMQCMNTLAPIYNVGVVDVVRNITSKQPNKIQKAAWGILSVAPSLAMTGATRDGFNRKLPTRDELPDGSMITGGTGSQIPSLKDGLTLYR